MAYIANTPDDIRVMLGTIGLDSLDQLFDMVPPEFRLKRPWTSPPPSRELELTNHISALLAKNQGADQRVCFLGAGSYDHFIPAVVDHLAVTGRVLHVLHAVPARGKPGDASGHVRVPDPRSPS